MKNIDSFNDENLPESYRVVVQEFFKASKHENKKTMCYSEDWILKCLLFHIRSASGYNFILKNDILPLPKTLCRYLSLTDTKFGFDSNLFTIFEKHISSKND